MVATQKPRHIVPQTAWVGKLGKKKKMRQQKTR